MSTFEFIVSSSKKICTWTKTEFATWNKLIRVTQKFRGKENLQSQGSYFNNTLNKSREFFFSWYTQKIKGYVSCVAFEKSVFLKFWNRPWSMTIEESILNVITSRKSLHRPPETFSQNQAVVFRQEFRTAICENDTCNSDFLPQHN